LETIGFGSEKDQLFDFFWRSTNSSGKNADVFVLLVGDHQDVHRTAAGNGGGNLPSIRPE